MAKDDIEGTVRDYIVNNFTTMVFISGVNIITGPLPDDDDDDGLDDLCVFILETGGPIPSRNYKNSHQVEYPHIQILIRGSKEDRPSAKTIANALLKFLQSNTDTSYKDVSQLQSKPTFLQWDDEKRPIYSINFEVTYQREIT